jgi:hypothetical protein
MSLGVFEEQQHIYNYLLKSVNYWQIMVFEKDQLVAIYNIKNNLRSFDAN